MRLLTRLSLLLSLMAGASALPAARASINERVFDRAWSLVADRYWDRSMGGNDWNAIRDEYHPKAMAARDEKQLYAVVNRMLDQLDDSHVYATSPSDLRWSREPTNLRDVEPGRRLVHIPGGILLIGFDQFDPGDDRWIANAIAGTPDLRGVILDLRGNGGGRDDVLDKVAGLFSTRRQLLIRLTGKKVIEESTRGAGASAYRGPLAVLVGPQTASAAEILAFYLDESGRAYTVGERSAGAVTGGVDYNLPGGGQLTVAEYDIRTANGTRLEGNGFTPKYQAPSARTPNDAALAKAVGLIRGARTAQN
ncbi:S41 family peptidase [Sphingomonas sp. SRS2]|uniref:S41 family peptidase n=1 Tax=Sphingomonas sp. SRS2 TaxID=133190 RepID=UPI0006183F63|nr:S41 family peptidase [Sphingomonas sp. SRS2]KKC27938.1 peptidase S41 [Sphingomonas sp. SRS2]